MCATAIDAAHRPFHRSLRLQHAVRAVPATLNAMMVDRHRARIAIVLWTQGAIEVGTVAMALPLTWQIVNIAGWVA